ncbi:glycine-rich domain-containing protein [Mycolicibacterium psychrotolerans]|uniref:glycine-rich domain-containing protein n=1 Tax=Mycolicibacterium psychrotolerans TaxID=216929 RepID=UPI003D664D7B
MALEARLEQALAFPAPFVIERLVKDRIADTADEAELLFAEAKKYLVLCEATPDMSFGMPSAMVDQAWHAFILFTTEYSAFGHRFFGRYLHHSPAIEHDLTPRRQPNIASLNDFQSRYQELFGEPLPAIWHDDTSVTPSRRVLNNDILRVDAAAGDEDTVALIDDTGATVLEVNSLAREALVFIAGTRDFYVRELPGGLTDDEKVGLIEALVRSHVLRVAP